MEKALHRTFSLLPHFLVPRYQHDLNTMLDTLCHQNRHPKPAFVQTKNLISSQGLNDDIPLENGHIHRFRKLFDRAFYKFFSIPELNKNFHIEITNDPVRKMLNIIPLYSSPFQTTGCMQIPAIEKIAWDFLFNYQTGGFFVRYFLFGTPSQKQI